MTFYFWILPQVGTKEWNSSEKLFSFFPSGSGRAQYLIMYVFLWGFQTRMADWRYVNSYSTVLWFLRKTFILARVTEIKLLREILYWLLFEVLIGHQLMKQVTVLQRSDFTLLVQLMQNDLSISVWCLLKLSSEYFLWMSQYFEIMQSCGCSKTLLH